VSAGFIATGGNWRHPEHNHVSNHKTKNTSCITDCAVTNENDPWFMAYDLDWDVSNDTPIDEDAANSIMNAGRNTYAAQAYFPYSLYKRVQVPLRKRACRPLQSEKRGFGFPFPVDKSDPFLFGTDAQIRSSKLTLFYSNCCIFKYV
jgi:hypothetical protein